MPKKGAQPSIKGSVAPFPIRVVPAKDPPTVATNPRRKIVLCFDRVLIAGATEVIDRGSIDAALQAQINSGSFGWMLHYLHVWGPLSPGEVAPIKLTDTRFQTTVTDNSTVVDRARVGLSWPPIAQLLSNDLAASSTPVASVTSVLAGTLTFRVGVTYWGSSLLEPA